MVFTPNLNNKLYRAAEGINIINRLDDEVFTTVINYVHKNMSPDESEDDQGLEELEKMVKVDRQDFLLLIKTLSYILKRASTFIMRPTKLQQELKDKLHLHESKIEVIMKLWIKNVKPILDNLETDEAGKPNELVNVGWKLKVQLASEAQQKEKNPIAQLQLSTSVGEPVDLEVNHTELLSMYNQLEAIQSELDSLRSK